MIARQDDTVVDALLRRLERDGHLHLALHVRNLQHQVFTDISDIIAFVPR